MLNAVGSENRLLKTCQHETITGGTVYIGAEHSDVVGGKLVRTKVPCDGGKMQLTFPIANASGATSCRDRRPNLTETTIYAVAPLVQVDDGRALVIERLDQPQERMEFAIGRDWIRGAFFDLYTANKLLSRGATYRATLGNSQVSFNVHPKAVTGKAPAISRLLRFPD